MLFRELEIGQYLDTDPKPLSECELFFKGEYDNTRLYVSRRPGIEPNRPNGFEAYALSFKSASTQLKDVWEEPDLEVEVVFKAVAAFDGVRHIYFNSEDDGYIYYPDLVVSLLPLLEALHRLELEQCPDCDKRGEA